MSLSLEPMFESLLVASIAAIVVLAVLWMVTPPATLPRQRWTLFSLRAVAGVVLLLAAFRPTLVRSDRRPADATLVIAVDQSRSMTLSDGQGGDRWTRQRKAFEALVSHLQGLDETLAVRVLAYDGGSRYLELNTSSALDKLEPDGDSTDLEVAATSAIEIAAGKPIAGIVLMGDGTHTAAVRGGGPLRVAETLNSLGIPLWTVPVGITGDASEARDVAVESLPESLQLFAGNQIEIPFSVSTRAFAGLSIPIRLTWIAQDGKKTKAGERSVIPSKALDSVAMTVEAIVPAPGSYRLVVEAEQQSGELNTTNNQQIAFADVREGGGRILYLEGQPRLEQKYLRTALRRFPDLDLTYQWIPSDTQSRWPIEIEPLLRRGRFDAFILGDLDASALGPEQIKSLSERVFEGAGLVTLGGFNAYERGGYTNTTMAEVLPIKFDPQIPRAKLSSTSSVAASDVDSGQLVGDVQVVLGQPHLLTKLEDIDNEAAWRKLPPLLGANRFAGPKIAPGVQVLLESDKEDPLLVIGEYGRGRVAALAMDSTWRWWRSGETQSHRRFWRQLMLWLLDRDSRAENTILVELDARRFASDVSPEFRATVPFSENGDVDVRWIAEIISETDEVTPVPMVTGESMTSATGKLTGLEPGLYRLRVRDGATNTSLVAAEIGFQVVDQSKELEQPLADPVYMQQLAEVTRNHGGSAFEVDEMDQLIDEIIKRRRRAEVPVIEKLRLGDGPISGWIVFTLFAAAMTTEWILRRRWSLP